MPETVPQRIIRVVAYISCIPESDFDLRSDLTQDLDLDSLDLVELTYALEDELNIEIADPVVTPFPATVGDLITRLEPLVP